MKYIVDFHNDAPDAEISKYLLDNGCTVLKEWDNFDKVFLVEAANTPPASAIVAHIVDDANEVAIKPLTLVDFNPYFGLHSTDDPNYPSATISTTDKQDWYKNYTLKNPVFDEPTATFTLKGSNVNVYVMDSGIDATHPEFDGVSITNIYSVVPGDYTDTTGHGTALSSVISGKTRGLSSAKLNIVKIFHRDVTTYQSNFLDALDAVMASMPIGGFSILNCSWFIARNEWVEYKLKECIDRGMWVITAAGNNGAPIGDVTPAAMPEAFVVGAYNPDLLPCDFSNYTGDSSISITQGQTNSGALDGWAPGLDIYVACLTDPNKPPIPGGTYGYVGGTSIAAAIASGVAANNLSDLIDSTGMRALPVSTMLAVSAEYESSSIVSRPGLLDLSDPKYANSKNLIATIGNSSTITQSPDEMLGALRAGTEGVVCIPFSPHLTKSFDLLDPLPENFSFLPSGALYGQPTLAQAPADGNPYVLYTVHAKRIDINDVEETIKIDIYILPSNFKPTDLPEDHPIQITFTNNCVGWGYASCSLQYQSNCVNQCYNSICCGSGKASYCNCVAF